MSKKLEVPAKTAILIDTKAAYKCQPSYHIQHVKLLFSCLGDNGINMSFQDHFTFSGGAASTMTKHFQAIQCHCQYYGMCPNCIATDPEYHLKIRANDHKFDLDNVKDVQQLVATGLEQQIAVWRFRNLLFVHLQECKVWQNGQWSIHRKRHVQDCEYV